MCAGTVNGLSLFHLQCHKLFLHFFKFPFLRAIIHHSLLDDQRFDDHTKHLSHKTRGRLLLLSRLSKRGNPFVHYYKGIHISHCLHSSYFWPASSSQQNDDDDDDSFWQQAVTPGGSAPSCRVATTTHVLGHGVPSATRRWHPRGGLFESFFYHDNCYRFCIRSSSREASRDDDGSSSSFGIVHLVLEDVILPKPPPRQCT